MAGKRKVFEKAMKKAANYAWDQEWEKAIAEYERALKEFPQDLTALIGLGLAHLESRHLEEALEIYQEISQLTPDDPDALSRMADIQERLGHLEEAADTYINVAEIYLQHQAMDKAIDTWSKATRLVPSHLTAHQKLAEVYVQRGKTNLAIKEYLALARIFQHKGDDEKAIQFCQMALKLDSRNPEAQAMLEGLRYGEAAKTTSPTLIVSEIGEEASFIEVSKRKALSDLAMYLFEEIPQEEPSEISAFSQTAEARATATQPRFSRTQINAVISQAIDFHRRNMTDEAIASYERGLDAGVNRPSLHFNLGLLYQEKLRLDEAIARLRLAVRHPDYALAGHFVSGECYRAQGKMENALEHLVEVLKIVDMQTVDEERAHELTNLYAGLSTSYRTKGDKESVLSFANSLIEFFSQEGWETKIMEMRRHLNEISDEGTTMALAQVLEVPGFEEILQALADTQRYMDSDMIFTAMEECYRAIEMAPTYLPLHLRLAEIFLHQDLLEDAVAKYMHVADVYVVWGNTSQAHSVYQRVLQLAPMDVNVRSKLIDLAIQQGRIDQALEHYLALADAYYQLAHLDKTIEVYKKALQLSPKSSSPKKWQIRILHLLADMQMQRVDWRQATTIYQQIKSLAPEDEQARLQLIDLHFKQGQTDQAMQEVDELTTYYQEQNQLEKVLSTLQQAVQLRPYEMPLRARLSQVYLKRGLKQEAIAELDALGEMQLEAGMRKEAVETIKLIISLSPKNVRAYKQLLDQILG